MRCLALLALMASIALVAGCSSAPAEDTAAIQSGEANAKASASTWTPEMKEAFKTAKTAPENQH